MAISEWKKFDFFTLVSNADTSRVVEIIGDSDIKSCTSSSKQKIICDSAGRVNIFYQYWYSLSFQAHNSPIILCSIGKQSNLLVTVSIKNSADRPIVKVWDLSKVDKRSGAPCLGTAKLIPQKPSALSVEQLGSILYVAVGFENGEISFFSDVVGREFYSNFCTLKVCSRSINGIALNQQRGKSLHMFVCSDCGVFAYILQENDNKEIKITLDTTNARTRCCALQTKGPNDAYFMTGRDDAVYCYTSDGRGPCYALEGHKQFIGWFSNYLVIVMKLLKNSFLSQKEYVIIVIDIQNKFIVLNTPIDPVVAILNETGTCFILTEKKEVYYLLEKNIQSKLNILYKKNLFDIAVRIKKDQQYSDDEEMANIYRQYGDHLYWKGDYAGAVERYIKTIGFIETSYVIKKLLDSRHIHFLAKYLQVLHQRKLATQEHKILLMKCNIRLNFPQKLNFFEFIDEVDDIMFDINGDVYSKKTTSDLPMFFSMEHTEQVNQCQNSVRLLLDKVQVPGEGLKLISENEIHELFKKNGLLFNNQYLRQTIDMLTKVCEVHKTIAEDILRDITYPENFSDFFEYGTSDFLCSLQRSAISQFPYSNDTIYNALIELHLKQWKNDSTYESTLLEMLQIYSSRYCKNHILIMCRVYKFWPGVMWLYENAQLNSLKMRYYVKSKDYTSILTFCKYLGEFNPHLWIQALNEFHNYSKVSPHILIQIMNVITAKKLLSPLEILQCLTVESGPNVALVKDLYTQLYQKEATALSEEEKEVEMLQTGMIYLLKLIHSFLIDPIEFRNTICDACGQLLTLPSVHFLCQHSFHKECIQVYSENTIICYVCRAKSCFLTDMIKYNDTQIGSQGQNETFHNMRNRSNDLMLALSVYFGKDLLNQHIIVDVQNTYKKHLHNKNNNQYKWKKRGTTYDSLFEEHINIYSRNNSRVRDRSLYSHISRKMYIKKPLIPSHFSEASSSFKYENSKNNIKEDVDIFLIDEANKKNVYSNENPFEEYDNNLNPFAED